MKISIATPNFLKFIPNNSGVYRFFDELDNLLYVGKAINLQKRVKSYFSTKINTSPRINLMIQKINYIELTVTENEQSALILENNLIKQLKPKYNIIFRDDKTYPLIRITNHEFPKIDYYRGKTNNSDTHFGPYPNATATKQTIDTIQKIFKLRTCSNSFFENRTKPCILYQIDRCTAPCVGYVNRIQYNEQILLAKEFLNGKYQNVLKLLTEKMHEYANSLEFESATTTRNKILHIKSLQNQQIITQHNNPLNIDVIIFEPVDNKLYIYLIIVRKGLYIGDNHFTIDISNNSINNIVAVFLENYYMNNKDVNTIFIDCNFDQEFMHFFTKIIGIRIIHKPTHAVNKLLAMAHFNLSKIIEFETKQIKHILELINQLLKFKVNRIECIDISHNHGENTVAAISVFDNNKIDHNLYRKYNLSHTNGSDVLAMEITLKKRLTANDTTLPQLILVDGGMQQFTQVKNIVCTLGLYDKIRVIAIFKGEKRNPKLDRLILDDKTIVANSDAPDIFRLLQELRDEAHRFAITGHRKKQIKKMTKSILEDIPNVGSKTKKVLLTHFGSTKEIAMATLEDLQKVAGIGPYLANIIYSYFH